MANHGATPDDIKTCGENVIRFLEALDNDAVIASQARVVANLLGEVKVDANNGSASAADDAALQSLMKMMRESPESTMIQSYACENLNTAKDFRFNQVPPLHYFISPITRIRLVVFS